VMPFNILGIWIRGLLALAIPILALFCLKWWYDESWVEQEKVIRVEAGPEGGVITTVREDRLPQPAAENPAVGPGVPGVPDDKPETAGRHVFRFEPGWNRPTAELAAAIALLAWAVAGRWIGHGLDAIRLRVRGAVMGSGGGGPSSRSPDEAEVTGPDWLSGRGPIAAEEPQPEVPR